MNIHLANAEPAVESESKAHLGFVDCDVHPMFKSPTELQEFLPKRWREHAATVGRRSRGPFAATSSYPRMTPRQRHAR